MKLTISQCWCAALVACAIGGCGAKPPASAGTAPNAATTPGMMSPAQQQVELQQRMEAARNGGARAANGHPMSLETYRMMMDHMNAQQKIEYARKHPVAPSQ